MKVDRGAGIIAFVMLSIMRINQLVIRGYTSFGHTHPYCARMNIQVLPKACFLPSFPHSLFSIFSHSLASLSFLILFALFVRQPMRKVTENQPSSEIATADSCYIPQSPWNGSCMKRRRYRWAKDTVDDDAF